MAPKADNDVFLAVCFRNLKEKPQVNFEEVATETGMSVGGAKNKFREIMKRMGLDGKKEDDGEAKPKANPKAKAEPKPKPAKTAVKRKASAVKEDVPKDAQDNDDQENSASSDDNNNNNDDQPEAEESPTKKRKTAAASKKGKATTATADEPIDVADDESEAEKEKPTKAATRGKKAAGAKPAAKKATASKANKDISETEQEEKTKPATKAKPRGKAAKKVPEPIVEEPTASDANEPAKNDDNSDHNDEPTITAPHQDRPIPTRTRASSAKPATGKSTKSTTTKVEVIVPPTKGGRASSKTEVADANAESDKDVNEEGSDAMIVDSDDGDVLDVRGQDEV